MIKSDSFWLLFGLVMGFFLAGTLIWGLDYPTPSFSKSQSPPQSNSQYSGENRDAQPNGSKSAPFFVQVLPPFIGAETAGHKTEHDETKTTTDRWLMIFTGALALFTGALVIATGMLWKAGEKQIAITSIAANAAKQSADAVASGSRLTFESRRGFPGA